MPAQSAPTKLDEQLERWVTAGVLDQPAADRIRAFETKQGDSQKFRWPILLALGLGGLLLAAGVLLFVAAHWDELSPSDRFVLVLLLVSLFHIGGAVAAEKFAALARVLHAVGTVTLGAGIYLAAQIFNLQAHWPTGILLWAVGAALGWWILRDWVQGYFFALLAPAWVVSELQILLEGSRGGERLQSETMLLLAITYLTAPVSDQASPFRRTLERTGALVFLPLVPLLTEISGRPSYFDGSGTRYSVEIMALFWALGYGLPLLLAFFLRGRAAVINLAAAGWVWLLHTPGYQLGYQNSLRQLSTYVIWGLGAVGLVAWGLKESRRARINLGVLGFFLTVLTFYFSSVMDKMDRAASLFGLGILFLVGGWALEKTRRHLLARLGAGS